MRRQTTLPRSLHVSERAPQWERDNGLPGRHALSSPVPPRSCHSSLIAQNGLLRDCCLPLRHSLPFPFPRRRGAAMATPAPRPEGRPRQAGAERQPLLGPPLWSRMGRAKYFLGGSWKRGAAGGPAPAPAAARAGGPLPRVSLGSCCRAQA